MVEGLRRAGLLEPSPPALLHSPEPPDDERDQPGAEEHSGDGETQHAHVDVLQPRPEGALGSDLAGGKPGECGGCGEEDRFSLEISLRWG